MFSREGAGYASFYQVQQQLPWPDRCGLLKQARTAAVSLAEADGAASLWALHSDLRAAFYTMAAAQRRERVSGRFAVHFTRLDDFKPLQSGKVEVVPDGNGSPEMSIRPS